MGVISQFLQWIYPLGDLVIAICCFVYIKHKAGMLLGIAFSLLAFISLTWKIANMMSGVFDYDISIAYQIFGVTNPILFLVAVGLIITAVIKLGEIIASGTEFSDQTSASTVLGNINATLIGSSKSLGNVLIYIISAVAGAIFIGAGILLLAERHSEEEAFVVLFLGLVILLFSSIYFLVVLYRLWKYAITTAKVEGLTPSIESPGKAVGFLFIPLFGYYWAFIALGKLPKDLNAIANKRRFSNGISDGLGIVLAVFAVLSVIPFIGYVTSLILTFVLVPIFLSQSIRMVASLQSAGTDDHGLGENDLDGC